MNFRKRVKEEIIWPLTLILTVSTLLSVPLTMKCRATLLTTLLILGLVTGLSLVLTMILAYAQKADGRQKKVAAMIIWLHLGIAGANIFFECTTVFAMGLDALLLVALISYRIVAGRWLRWNDFR